MKRFLRILVTSILSVICAMGLFACGDPETGDKKGLLYKMYPGDDYYTVYGYVDEEKGLEELDIQAYLIANGETDVKIGRIKAGAFKNNDTLKSVVVPNTVEIIDAGAFANMKALESLTLPFIGYSKKTDASLNDTIPSEDKAVDAERTFAYVFGTDEYEGGVSINQYYANDKSNAYYLPIKLKNVTVKVAEEYNVPMYAFAGIQLLETVTLSGDIKVIGNGAFKNCYGLKNIVIPASVNQIGKEAFSGCVGIKNGLSFEANSTLGVLGEKAFSGCTKLDSIALPASLNKIPYGAFSGCSKLSNVMLGGVTEISAWAFYECNSLNYVGKGVVADKTIDLTGITVQDFAFAQSILVENYNFVVSVGANVFYNTATVNA